MAKTNEAMAKVIWLLQWATEEQLKKIPTEKIMAIKDAMAAVDNVVDKAPEGIKNLAKRSRKTILKAYMDNRAEKIQQKKNDEWIDKINKDAEEYRKTMYKKEPKDPNVIEETRSPYLDNNYYWMWNQALLSF